MPRNEKNRLVQKPPLYREFKPTGVAGRYLNSVDLSLDEYEALRLSDYECMLQEEAAAEMNISRPTFTRLIEKARHKLVEFIITGQKLSIGGGKIHFKKNIYKCLDCEQMFIFNMNETISNCPSCNSKHLVSLAGGFGHGRCCVNEINN